MKTRTLGRTGVQVSELIFGCGNVGGMMIHKPADEMRQAVAGALDAGINWFDTAAQYGDGKSEENLGKTLQALNAEAYISTKGTVSAANPAPFADQMEETLNASLARLGMDEIELFQLHGRVSTDGSGRALSPEQVLGP